MRVVVSVIPFRQSVDQVGVANEYGGRVFAIHARCQKEKVVPLIYRQMFFLFDRVVGVGSAVFVIPYANVDRPLTVQQGDRSPQLTRQILRRNHRLLYDGIRRVRAILAVHVGGHFKVQT